MHLKDIEFPVFAIGSYEKLWEENLILYLKSGYDIIYKVDNKNLAGDTVGKRRLRIPKNERYNFRGTFFTIYQMINSGKKVFIDNRGKVFRYNKSTKVDLIYREIKKIKRVEDEGYLIYANKVPVPIKVPVILFERQKYIGLLNYKGSYILYELTDEQKADTWRKI